jgi:hypothetical protein
VSSSRDPKDVLDELIRRYPRRKDTLRILHRVCEEQRRRGSHDYSIATLGPLSKENGGVDTQTMRNPNGKPFRVLIDAHETVHVPASLRLRRRRPSASASGRTPLQDAQVAALSADVARLTAERDRERMRSNKLQALVDATTSVVLEPDGSCRYGSPQKVELGPLAREAVRNVLDPAWREQHRVRVDRSGRVLGPSGETVLPAGFFGAFEALVAAAGFGSDR